MQRVQWLAHAAAIFCITLTSALAGGAPADVGESMIAGSLEKAADLNNLGADYSSQARYAEAEQHYRHALELWKLKEWFRSIAWAASVSDKCGRDRA